MRRHLIGGVVAVSMVVGAVIIISDQDEGQLPDVAQPANPVATTTTTTATTSVSRWQFPDLVPPDPAGTARFGPLVSGPSLSPSQVGPTLEGTALVTNQWWSSAMVGPGTGDLWAMPLVVSGRVGIGVEVRVPAVAASADAIVSSADPGLTVVADIVRTSVSDYDAFSVEVTADVRGGALARFRVAQGSPSFTIEMPAGPIVIDTHRSMSAPAFAGGTDALEIGSTDGRSWHVFTSRPLTWEIDETKLVATSDASISLTLVPRPDDASDDWEQIAGQLGSSPVTATASDVVVDWPNGEVVQTLRWARGGAESAGFGGASVLLPHHYDRLTTPVVVLGTFPTPRGLMRVVDADIVEWASPTMGFVPGVPGTALGDDHETAIARMLDDERPTIGSGSYFGSKQVAALATDVEIGRRLGIDVIDIETLLGEQVRNAIDYAGVGDDRWLAYDSTWGGVIAQPPEFGSEDYNDHHFHYGYLIHAAAVVAERDEAFAADYGPMIDLLVSDILGDPDSAGLPRMRNFNPFLGHSYASGFGLFADGNNQESSSEAVNAWWAAARWAIVTDQDDVMDRSIAHYVLESVAARTYWLGVDESIRPRGYDHRVAGIVWGGKVDFATWFDPRPSAVIGIQLLPVNFGSIYRDDPELARERYERSGSDLVWPDIAAMDLALADPNEALDLLAEIEDHDGGSSQAFARFWAASLAELGSPRSDITVDGPFGAAFGSDDRTVLVGVNPTDRTVEVGFRRRGVEIGRLSIGPHRAVLSSDAS